MINLFYWRLISAYAINIYSFIFSNLNLMILLICLLITLLILVLIILLQVNKKFLDKN